MRKRILLFSVLIQSYLLIIYVKVHILKKNIKIRDFSPIYKKITLISNKIKLISIRMTVSRY